MPHLFVNRHRLYDLTSEHPDVGHHFRWETINAVLYKIGGLTFIIGSVLFFPRYEAYADVGVWMFFLGSVLYLVVTGHDMCEVWHYWRDRHPHTNDKILEFSAATTYLVGTLLFIVGSIFFFSSVDWIVAGAWCFVIGSLLFLIGACVNVIQIVQERSLITLQLMNLTAISFIVGSVLFIVASIPYFWTVESAAEGYTLFSFVAWQYVIGSLLFFLGGVYNYSRVYVLMREETQTRSQSKDFKQEDGEK